jgi:hypothetical protein
MDKTAIEAKLIMDEFSKTKQLEDEFEKLAPSQFTFLIALFLMMGLIVFYTWWYPEISDSPLLDVIWGITFAIVAYGFQEIRRTNKRIDILYKIIKK